MRMQLVLELGVALMQHIPIPQGHHRQASSQMLIRIATSEAHKRTLKVMLQKSQGVLLKKQVDSFCVS